MPNFSNNHPQRWREYDSSETLKTFYAPDGQLAVTFFTGLGVTWGYDGFELFYTVQASKSSLMYI